jgi:glycosyltransferase involved in cell wall biosynthesis
VVINNYNYERFLREAIESALEQTRVAEVIVVDDGSSDGSRSVIDSFGARIQAVFKANGGQGSALNAGFARSTSDAVLFLDADDVLLPHAVETVLDSWRPGVALAHYPMKLISADGEPVGVYPDPPSHLADGDVTEELSTTGSCKGTVTSGMVFARWALELVLPMPEPDFVYCADGYLLRTVPFYGPLQRLDTPLACYRRHGGNFTGFKATSPGLAESFRERIRCAVREFEVVRDTAARIGHPVASDLGERDPDFLGYRLFSLLLDPERHPIVGDDTRPLLKRYVAARWASDWRLHRRALAITAASAAALGSRDNAATWIRWLHDSGSRPEWIRALWAQLRRSPGIAAPRSAPGAA